jgi:LDH2 family malate/lactate/ureidoglycolate dehydrogenase
VTDRAMRYTIDKAEQQQVAAATVYHQSHIGRLASYPLMAARDRNYLYRMIKRHGIARKE